jgi:hypothetical protein
MLDAKGLRGREGGGKWTYSLQTCNSKWIPTADPQVCLFWDTSKIFGRIAKRFGDFLDVICVFGWVFSGEG